jgi:hypothetical protein
MMVIGDGVLAAVFPVQHVERWDYEPKAWRGYLHRFIERPGPCRVLGQAEVIGGIAWAASLPSKPSDPRAIRDGWSCPQRLSSRATSLSPPLPAGRSEVPKTGPCARAVYLGTLRRSR